MKVALCCILKNENRYLKEYIEYYKKLGFDNIIVYDNNDPNGENINDVISEYIDSNYVIVNNVKGKHAYLVTAYNNCIVKYGQNYDWIAFFDVDEFLVLYHTKTILEYINTFPETCDCIHVNWMHMTDNDLVKYEDKPLLERFPIACEMYAKIYLSFPENQHIKSIVKMQPGIRMTGPHTCCRCKDCRDNKGDKCDTNSPFIKDINWDEAALKHFGLKTIEEFLYKKCLTGTADRTLSLFLNDVDPNIFFTINKRTPEKEKIFEEFKKQYKDKFKKLT